MAQLAVGGTDAARAGRERPPAGDGGTGPGVAVDDEGRIRHPLLAAAPSLALWRAPTDNDRIGGMAARWDAQGLDRLERRLLGIDRKADGIVVRTEVRTGKGHVVTHTQSFRGLPGGGVHVDEEAIVPAGLDGPRPGRQRARDGARPRGARSGSAAARTRRTRTGRRPGSSAAGTRR